MKDEKSLVEIEPGKRVMDILQEQLIEGDEIEGVLLFFNSKLGADGVLGHGSFNSRAILSAAESPKDHGIAETIIHAYHAIMAKAKAVEGGLGKAQGLKKKGMLAVMLEAVDSIAASREQIDQDIKTFKEAMEIERRVLKDAGKLDEEGS